MASASSSFAGTENPLSEGGVWATPTVFSAMRKATGAGVANASGVESDMRYTGVTFAANHYSEIVIAAIPNLATQLFYCYCNARMNATGGCYQVTTATDVGTNLLQLIRWSNAGVETHIGTDITCPTTISAGDVIRLSVVGTTLTVTYNGTIVRTATDSTWATGQPGIGGWAQNSASDVPFIASWSAADIVASDMPRSRIPNYLHSL